MTSLAASTTGFPLNLRSLTRAGSRRLTGIDPVEIGRRIAAARALAGISQSELAERIEFSVATVGRWERGEQAPRRAILNAIAEATRVPRDFFASADPMALFVTDRSNSG